ncbi:MAG: hypothetical protein FWH27_03055 [Planctomycetaceae bacterium]|nr:hypothetical protein [Planctomycetaceae bacterium]
MLLNGHPDPKIDADRKQRGIFVDMATDPEAIDRVLTWIDINAPYFPTYASAYPKNRFGRSPLDDAALRRLSQLCGTGDLKWAVSFDRPEISPCLARWSTPEQQQSPEYREALAIIKQGQTALAKTSRGEDPDFEPVIAREKSLQDKYDRLRETERTMRAAILSGNRLYDFGKN